MNVKRPAKRESARDARARASLAYCFRATHILSYASLISDFVWCELKLRLRNLLLAMLFFFEAWTNRWFEQLMGERFQKQKGFSVPQLHSRISRMKDQKEPPLCVMIRRASCGRMDGEPPV